MSLQVWLPLNGDLHNQGLANVTVTNNGATIDNNGKIGKCYNFAGSPQYINTGFDEDFGQGDFSISCWIKIIENTSMRYQCIIGNKTTAAASKGCAIYYYQPTGKFLWSTADGSGATEIFTVNSFKQHYGEWIHIAMIRNSSDSKKGYFYINGEREELASIPVIRDVSQTAKMFIGSCLTLSKENYYFTGSINDIRIYDHALSPLEVKHLAQGLVLHYPLNRGGFGGENLLANTDFGGVSKKYTLMSGTEGGFSFPPTTWKRNTQYTLSCRLRGNANINLYLISSAGNEALHWVNREDLSTTDYRLYTITFTSKSDRDVQNLYICTRYGASNSTIGDWFEIENNSLKLEYGSVPTTWTPAPSDDLFSQMGLDNNIEYDVSGYGNNGTRVGTFSWSGDTPRYGVSTQFNGSQYIQLPFPCGMISEAVTVACWGYESNWDTVYAERLIGAATGSSGWCIGDYGSENTLFAFYANGSYNAASGFKQLSNGWHHFAITFDGFNLKYYVDGVLFSSKTFSTKQSATGVYNIQIGQHYGGACSFRGNMSDVRIYATALSADDVMALYHTPIFLSNNGTLLTQGEFVES